MSVIWVFMMPVVMSDNEYLLLVGTKSIIYDRYDLVKFVLGSFFQSHGFFLDVHVCSYFHPECKCQTHSIIPLLEVQQLLISCHIIGAYSLP